MKYFAPKKTGFNVKPAKPPANAPTIVMTSGTKADERVGQNAIVIIDFAHHFDHRRDY